MTLNKILDRRRRREKAHCICILMYKFCYSRVFLHANLRIIFMHLSKRALAYFAVTLNLHTSRNKYIHTCPYSTPRWYALASRVYWRVYVFVNMYAQRESGRWYISYTGQRVCKYSDIHESPVGWLALPFFPLTLYPPPRRVCSCI